MGDPQGKRIIFDAYQGLQGRAAQFQDEVTRRSFLENVPENRDLCALYEKFQDASRPRSQQEVQPVEPPSIQAQPAPISSQEPGRLEARPASVCILAAPVAPQPVQAPMVPLGAVQVNILSSSTAPNPGGQSTPSPSSMPDKAILAAQTAAQIAALLGQSGQTQGVTINIHLGDIRIDRVEQLFLEGQLSTQVKEAEQVQPQDEPNPASSRK